ncbi:cupin domain-containing protein [Janibacter anophelis]|uniref:cupin domain-containing protein n=1 Tax=Janibacter anophelis TaxID=319054 RepID=UPI003F7DAFD0
MDTTLHSVDGLLELAPVSEGGRPGVKKALVGHGARVVMFRFAAGQVLAEHTAAFPILVQCLEGEVEFVTGEQSVTLTRGAVANLDARVPHEVRGVTDAVFQLVMLDPQAEPPSA